MKGQLLSSIHVHYQEEYVEKKGKEEREIRKNRWHGTIPRRCATNTAKQRRAKGSMPCVLVVLHRKLNQCAQGIPPGCGCVHQMFTMMEKKKISGKSKKKYSTARHVANAQHVRYML